MTTPPPDAPERDVFVWDATLSAPAQQAAFDELLAYAHRHFEDEEQRMRDVGVDPRHRGRH